MTRWPHRETVTDQSQGVELPTIHPVVPNCSMPELMTKMDAGVAVHDGARSSAKSQGTPIVFVVDDDVSVRELLELLICNAGWQPETFASAQEFLCRERVLVPSCLVLDIALPDLNGLDLQKRLAADPESFRRLWFLKEKNCGPHRCHEGLCHGPRRG